LVVIVRGLLAHHLRQREQLLFKTKPFRRNHEANLGSRRDGTLQINVAALRQLLPQLRQHARHLTHNRVQRSGVSTHLPKLDKTFAHGTCQELHSPLQRCSAWCCPLGGVQKAE